MPVDSGGVEKPYNQLDEMHKTIEELRAVRRVLEERLVGLENTIDKHHKEIFTVKEDRS